MTIKAATMYWTAFLAIGFAALGVEHAWPAFSAATLVMVYINEHLQHL